jgi:hypothetical protein
MKKKSVMVFSTIMLLVISLTGCAKAPGFTVGKWNQNVFENTWLNLKFDVPTDWDIASKEEIKAIIGAGADALNIEGTSAEQLKAAAELKTIYAFMVNNPKGLLVQLMYENLALTIGGTKYTEAQYLDELSKIMLSQDSVNYKFVSQSTTTITDKSFQKLELSAFEGKLIQDYYAYKKNQFMVVIIVSYTPEMKTAETEFMNNIHVLK